MLGKAAPSARLGKAAPLTRRSLLLVASLYRLLQRTRLVEEATRGRGGFAVDMVGKSSFGGRNAEIFAYMLIAMVVVC